MKANEINFELGVGDFHYHDRLLDFNFDWQNLLYDIKEKVALSDIVECFDTEALLEEIGQGKCMEYFDLIEKSEMEEK